MSRVTRRRRLAGAPYHSVHASSPGAELSKPALHGNQNAPLSSARPGTKGSNVCDDGILVKATPGNVPC